ncbi:putative hypothetical protein [Streptomyces sp. NBRC 110611]|nr:putative hypothetical protein [Streptomyces sp. NBRC 110611]
MGSGGGHTTDFSSRTLETLKAMVRDAQPDRVEEIADHWMHVHDQLAGDAPDGSVRDLLDKAVADVLEYWHGSAASAFAARAKTLSTSLRNGSLYAKNTSHTLKAAAIDLREVKRAVTALQDTESERKSGNIVGATISFVKDGVDKAEDWFSGRDDTGLKRDIAKGMGADEARARNADTLSRGREIALQAAAHMERLGASYNAKMNQLTSGPVLEKGTPVREPETIVPAPIISAGATPTVVSPRTTNPTISGGRRSSGGTAASGGLNSPHTTKAGGAGERASSPLGEPHQPMPQTPRPGTGLDGVRGGVPNPTTPPVTSPSGPVVGGTPGNSGLGPGGPAIPPGGPTVGGRGPLVGRTPRPGHPGVPSTPPSGRVGAGKPAIPGAPGQPGQAGRPPIGGTTGSGTSGKDSVRGRQGGLARRPGGIVGEPSRPGVPGRGTQGGSGLHRSRGGALNSGPESSSRARGPMGVPPGGRSPREDKEQRRSSRPDYLVEDEETWASQRDVVPGVIGMAASEEAVDAVAPEQRSHEVGPDSSEGSGKA